MQGKAILIIVQINFEFKKASRNSKIEIKQKLTQFGYTQPAADGASCKIFV